MPPGSQLKVKLKNQGFGAFSLDAMGCAVLLRCRVLLPASPTPKSTPHPFIKEDFNSLSSTSVLFPLPISHYIDFSPSLAPFNPVLEVQTLNIYLLNVAKCSQEQLKA